MPNFMLFLATSVAITFAPGPDNLQVLARGISQGRAAGFVAALGFTAGILFHTTLAALGVAAVLRSSPVAFEILKLAGAAYLVWIGIKALRSQGLANAHERPPQPLGTIFRQSVIGNLMNPKVTLFFVVFLPQFVDPSRGQALQYSVLVATFAACELFWYVMYAAGGHGLRRWLAKPFARRWFERLVGSVFLAFAVALLRFRPR